MGYEYFIAIKIVFSVILSFQKKSHITLGLSFFILLLSYLLRHPIHYQGLIDHDHNSKTRIGFIMLFIITLIHFYICLFLSFMKLKKSY